MKTVELDVVFISYDEPNADLHYADLCNKVPWAKRVHGVKGSDHAHKAAAEKSDTDWVITVDADNLIDPKFFSVDFDHRDSRIQVYSWLARNRINGLLYGNGGLKIWRKDFILNMKTHEASDSDRAQVDFCWENGYQQFKECYSETVITGSPFQAWRAGFREGVKMTLLDGVKVPPDEIKDRIWWHNLHRLKIWSTIGAHEDNGLYAIYGARLGQWMANCTEWNYIEVRDFEILRSIWNQYGRPYEEVNGQGLEEEIENLGQKIKEGLGFDYPLLNSLASKFALDLYNETVQLTKTYLK